MTGTAERGPTEARVVDTKTLLRLDLRAHQDGLNRSLPEEVRASLDPDGYHVLTVALPFHNGVDAAPYPHHRTMLLLKMIGRRDPAEALIDVATREWDRLPLARELVELGRRLASTNLENEYGGA